MQVKAWCVSRGQKLTFMSRSKELFCFKLNVSLPLLPIKNLFWPHQLDLEWELFKNRYLKCCLKKWWCIRRYLTFSRDSTQGRSHIQRFTATRNHSFLQLERHWPLACRTEEDTVHSYKDEWETLQFSIWWL